MDTVRQQLLLQTWTSSAFPTGAFTCSHGLETAINDARVHDADSAFNWIAGIISHGSGWNDSVLLMAAYRASEEDEPFEHSFPATLNDINALSLALCSGAERYRETCELGQAFLHAAGVFDTGLSAALESINPVTLPVVTGTAGARQSLDAEALLAASLQAMSSNLAWIGTRLIPLGQQDTLSIIARLQPIAADTAQRALHSTIDDLGGSCLLADIASMEHERLYGRVCIT